MSTPTHRSSSGFTLIEVVVVMSIITILMGMGIPGIINAQRRADRYATVNILQTVHDACQGNAKQFGGAGAVYGFTLGYTQNSTSYISGQYSASAIRPWVIQPDATSTVVYNTAPANLLQADIGKEMMWTSDTIEFVDTMVPSRRVIIDAVDTNPLPANQYLHIAYEPRTGFPHALLDGNPGPTTATLKASAIAASTSVPNSISIVIWRKGSSAIATNAFIIKPTGVSDVRLAP